MSRFVGNHIARMRGPLKLDPGGEWPFEEKSVREDDSVRYQVQLCNVVSAQYSWDLCGAFLNTHGSESHIQHINRVLTEWRTL